MANHPLWQEEYWLPLMQLYLKKPVGVKAIYSRAMVELALELNIEPQFLYEQMFRLRRHSTPSLNLLWDKFANHSKKLNAEVEQLRLMRGFNHPDEFYRGVEIKDTWQNDFKWLKNYCDENNKHSLMPIHMIVILDLYFRLTPITMVTETPEIQDLAKIMDIQPELIVDVMDTFQQCDPYLNRITFEISPLFDSCHEIWQRYGNGNPQELAALASQLKEYFRK
jgi:hypothetical protein